MKFYKLFSIRINMNEKLQELMDNFKNPRNYREIIDPTLTKKITKASCGDKFTIFIKTDKDCIKDISFIGTGCSVSTAGLSYLTEFSKNKSKQDIQNLQEKDFLEYIGVQFNQNKKGCILIGFKELKKTFE